MTIKLSQCFKFMDAIALSTFQFLCEIFGSENVEQFAIDNKEDFENAIREYSTKVMELSGIENVEEDVEVED